MAKKKSAKSLKASVQRGFATTSIAKKQTVQEVVEAEEEDQDSQAVTDNALDTAQASTSVTESTEFSLEDAEQHQLQLLAARVRPAAHKEYSRIIKTVEYDKRISQTLPAFHWKDTQTSEKVLNRTLQAEAQVSPKCLPGDTQEKLLIKAAILSALFQKLGFSEERIRQVLSSVGLLDFEQAVRWLVLRCRPQELSFEPSLPGSFTQNGTSTVTSSESTSEQQSGCDVSIPPSPSKTGSQTPAFEATPLAANTIDPELDSDIQSSMKAISQINIDQEPTMAYLNAKIEMLNLTRNNQADSPAAKELHKIMDKASKAYLFDRRDAESGYREHVAKLGAAKKKQLRKDRQKAKELVAADLSKVTDDRIGATKDHAKQNLDGPFSVVPQEEPSKDSDNLNGSSIKTEEFNDVSAKESKEPSEDGDESMLGALGQMMEEMPTEELTDNGTIAKVRDMKLPKHFSGKSPKALLEDLVRRKDKMIRPTFAVISKSRAVRARVYIRWSSGDMQTFQMEDEACHDQAQAYNYVATMALFALDTASLSRQLPPVFKDLWTELERKKKETEDAAYRDHLQQLLTLIEARENQFDAPAKLHASVMDTNGHTSQDRSERHKLSFDPTLQQEFLERQVKAAYLEMLEYRTTLPIASYRGHIMQMLDTNQVIVLSGETGSGKSTQLPVFILEQELRQGRPVKIYCTQPRRISAISLAQRVSRELGDQAGMCGTRQSLVGYSIRLESRVSANTRLVYATTGIVLRMLEGDHRLDEITHLIIDEIHERSIESDFLLIILRDLMKKRQDLKVILMSATLDANKISEYMGGCPVVNVHGRTFAVSAFHLEDVIEMTGYRLDPQSDSPYINWKRKPQNTKRLQDGQSDDEDEQLSSSLGAQYSQRTRTTLEILDEIQINYDLIIALLEQICLHNTSLASQYSGAILIFMPSLESIRRISELIESHPTFGTSHYEIHPLHSSITSEHQSRVFLIPPPGVRKIVIATNIAETGVTIPDVTCVIDSGKHREMRYDEKRQISRLVETYIAKSNATQRRGRAGRVQEGIAFHLFTRARMETQMAEHPIPEMLRLSLQDLALRIKTLTIFEGSIEDVLSRALDKPLAVNVQRAINALQEVKALTLDEKITPLGRHLVKLPVDVHLGKFLLLACLFKCLDPALTIAASLSSKSPFVTPFGRESEAEAVKRAFKTEDSDFLTLHRVFSAWKQAALDGTHFSFCRKNFVSNNTLQQIEELRQQFYDYLCDSGLIESGPRAFDYAKSRVRFIQLPSTYDVNSTDSKLVMACVAAGMYPKLLVADSTGQFRTFLNNAPASVHPSSVNFGSGRKSDFGESRFVTYFNIQHTKKLYVWETGTVDELAIYLLCGELDTKLAAHSFSVDRKIKLRVSPKSALAIKVLKAQYQRLFNLRMNAPSQPFTGTDLQWWDLVLDSLRVPKDDAQEQMSQQKERVLTMSVR